MWKFTNLFYKNKKELIFISILIIADLISLTLTQISEQASSISICPLGQVTEINEEQSKCFSYSTPNVECCILRKFRKDLTELPDNICWGFKSDNIQDIFSYNSYSYKVFCKEDLAIIDTLTEDFSIPVSESDLKSCGVERPETDADCNGLSDETGSCCLLSYNAIKQCIKMAKRYLGTINHGGLTLFCNETFVNFTMISKSFIITLFLIIIF